MVGRLLSFWDGIFSGAMLNFQGVPQNGWFISWKTPKWMIWLGKPTIFGNIHMDVIGCLVGFVNGSMVNGSVGFFTYTYK